MTVVSLHRSSWFKEVLWAVVFGSETLLNLYVDLSGGVVCVAVCRWFAVTGSIIMFADSDALFNGFA